MKITFWGTRGSIASPGPDTVIYGGNTTCVEIDLSFGRTVIIDAGTGIRKLGDALVAGERQGELLLLITHIHWDHILGFPFFAPLFHDCCRIVVDGSRKCMEGLKRVFSSNYIDGTWPVRFEDLKARIEHSHELHSRRTTVDGTLIETHQLQHPQGGLGFKFTEASGAFVFLTDNELREDGWKGSCFTDFVRFCQGADLLVHDCQYTPEEMTIRRGWGHSDVACVARLAVEAGVKRLVLFHHDPWRTDEGVSDMVSRCRALLDDWKSSISVEAAREGSTHTV